MLPHKLDQFLATILDRSLAIHRDVRASRPRLLTLSFAAGGADDVSTRCAEQLAEPQADASCSGVYEYPVARADGVSFRDHGDGGEALQEGCGTLFEGDGRWEGADVAEVRDSVGGIGGSGEVGDACAWEEGGWWFVGIVGGGRWWTTSDDGASTFAAEGVGKGGSSIQAGTEVAGLSQYMLNVSIGQSKMHGIEQLDTRGDRRINEVNADKFVLDENFAFTRLRHW